MDKSIEQKIFNCIASNDYEGLLTQISLGANLNFSDAAGNSPLIHSIIHKNDLICETLISSGADIHCQNDFGETPLMIASLYGYTKIVKYLLNQSVDISYRSFFGETAMRMAKYKPEIVQLLKKKGVSEKDELWNEEERFDFERAHDAPALVPKDYLDRFPEPCKFYNYRGNWFLGSGIYPDQHPLNQYISFTGCAECKTSAYFVIAAQRYNNVVEFGFEYETHCLKCHKYTIYRYYPTIYKPLFDDEYD